MQHRQGLLPDVLKVDAQFWRGGGEGHRIGTGLRRVNDTVVDTADPKRPEEPQET